MTCEVASCLLHERALAGAAVGPEEPGPELEQHLDGCAGCREEREAVLQLVVALPTAILAPERPSPRLRDRLLAGTRHGRALPTFAGAVAQLFDLAHAEAQTLLAQLVDPAAWRPGLVPGNSVRPVHPGARAGAQAVGMLLRTTPGTRLPFHAHDSFERTFVLQGGYRDSTGRAVWAGEYADMPVGSSHELRVLAPVDCIAAVLYQGGIPLAR